MLIEQWWKQPSSPEAETTPPELQPVKSPTGIGLKGH
jgi:hypothetical protein